MDFVAYEAIDWPGKPQVYFTLVTRDNLPAKRSTSKLHSKDTF